MYCLSSVFWSPAIYVEMHLITRVSNVTESKDKIKTRSAPAYIKIRIYTFYKKISTLKHSYSLGLLLFTLPWSPIDAVKIESTALIKYTQGNFKMKS